MKFRCVAPYALEVPSLGVGTVVQPGQVVEVRDRAVAAGMVGQAVWQPVTKKEGASAADDAEETEG